MPAHQNHPNRQTYYIVIFTCYRLLSLLEKSQVYDFFPKWLRDINKRGVLNCGYVFMHNVEPPQSYPQETLRGYIFIKTQTSLQLIFPIPPRASWHSLHYVKPLWIAPVPDHLSFPSFHQDHNIDLL